MLSGKRGAVLGVVLVLAGAPLAWPRADTLAPCALCAQSCRVLKAWRNDGRLAQRGIRRPANRRRFASALWPAQRATLPGPQPCRPNPIAGVDCFNGNCGERVGTDGPVDWRLRQGEYVGHARLPHVPNIGSRRRRAGLRLSPDAQQIVAAVPTERWRRNSCRSPRGREIEAKADHSARRHHHDAAAGPGSRQRRTVPQLHEELEQGYKNSISPSHRQGHHRHADQGQHQAGRHPQYGRWPAGLRRPGPRAKVTPEGTIQLPAIGSVPAQGLTLESSERDHERYATKVEGIEVMPVLHRAAAYVYVLGEVRPRPLQAHGPDDGDAIDQHGRWLERRRKRSTDRGLSPWRRLAVDGHGARSARRDVRKRPCPPTKSGSTTPI